ncbi:hypothetical protein D3C86_1428370 [compost metagenome]
MPWETSKRFCTLGRDSSLRSVKSRSVAGVGSRQVGRPVSESDRIGNRLQLFSMIGAVGAAPLSLRIWRKASPVAAASFSVRTAVKVEGVCGRPLRTTAQATWTMACENSPKSPIEASMRTSPSFASRSRQDAAAFKDKRLAGNSEPSTPPGLSASRPRATNAML